MDRIISVATKKSKIYYKVQAIAEEILDDNGNPTQTNGAVPDGEIVEFASNLQTVKHYKNGVLHGKLQVLDITTGKVTLTEEYENGELKSIVDTATRAPLSPATTLKQAEQEIKEDLSKKGLVMTKVKDNLVFCNEGQEVARCLLLDGSLLSGKIPDGIIKEYYESGVLRTEAPYKGGVMDGVVTKYDEFGRMILKENYVDGRLDGGAVYYNYRGQEKSKETAGYKNGRLEGRRTAFYPSGREFIVENYEANRLDGRREVYFESGILSLEENYKKGLLNGARVIYYPNGAMWYKEFYINAQLEGERLSCYPKGELYLKENYKHGLLEGTKIVYDKTGTAVLEEEYSFGEKVKKRGKP
ncbi:MAG: toxin-antitoxin system YwqK family antitoxin [Elusimicrobia bacterium]|nr:toxin-antitoxin system YwqK family antitoxin [Elusimicrobiota bacterium]